ncbi:MAG: hypothetical protein ACREH3_09285, partial [Geminicoccales bacterium]
MTRIPPEAVSSPRPSWRSLLRVPVVRRSLSSRGWLSLIGASAILLTGLGTIAVIVGATPEPAEPLWRGRIDDVAPGSRTVQLLGATAAGLEAQARRADAGKSSRLRAMSDALQASSERQGRLEDRLRAIENGSVELVGVRDALAELTERQIGIEAQLTAAADVAAIKAAAPAARSEVRALRLVAAALLLREGAQSAHPFASELARFSAAAAGIDTRRHDADLAPAMEQIALLQRYAQTGVVSWRDLRRSFASVAVLVERADPASWWQSALVLVGWRADPLQPLRQAQAALRIDDLETAVASLAALEGEPAIVTEGWLTLARDRLAADAIVDDLYRLA